MLRLNVIALGRNLKHKRNSNTTNVKVKRFALLYLKQIKIYSNTTNVKVKLMCALHARLLALHSNTTNV